MKFRRVILQNSVKGLTPYSSGLHLLTVLYCFSLRGEVLGPNAVRLISVYFCVSSSIQIETDLYVWSW